MAIMLGTGVGGAIVLNGRLHAGHAGLAGEWGHGPAAAGLSPALAKRIRAEIGIEAVHASCRRQIAADQVLHVFGFAGQDGEPDAGLIDEYRHSLANAPVD